MSGARGIGSLFHHRWAVPVLAELERGRGARFVVLVNRLGASRGAVRQALDALLDRGWAMRNPGYGHPLRPEYLLTAAGTPIGAASRRLFDVLRERGLVGIGLRKWSMPVLAATGREPKRYSELRRSLEGITDRELARTLRELEREGLVARRVVDGYPPATEYATTSAGEELGRLAEGVVRAAGLGEESGGEASPGDE